MTEIFRPHLAFTIEHTGPVRELVTSIKIGGPSLTGPFDPKKTFADFARAVWDTGAMSTLITQKVVDALSLQPHDMVKVRGVTGETVAPSYLVDIVLPNSVIVQNVPVLSGAIDNANFDVLVGMDIILMGDFFISRADGKTMFSFCIPPHKEPIDLVKKSNAVNEAIQKRMRRAAKRR